MLSINEQSHGGNKVLLKKLFSKYIWTVIAEKALCLLLREPPKSLKLYVNTVDFTDILCGHFWAVQTRHWAFFNWDPVYFCVCGIFSFSPLPQSLSPGSGLKGEFCQRPKIACQTVRYTLLKFSVWVYSPLCFGDSSSKPFKGQY